MPCRRTFLKSALPAAWMVRAADLYAQATRGLRALEITNVKVIGTSPGRGYSWVFVKVETSEPGLYGIGSANDRYLCWAVKTALEKHYAPFWKGQAAGRIEDLWKWNYQRAYWRNGPVTNVCQAALDSANHAAGGAALGIKAWRNIDTVPR